MTDINEIVQSNGEFVLAFRKELYSSLMSTPPHTRLVFHYLRLLANDGKPRGIISFPLHIPIADFLSFHFNIGIDDVRESLRILSEPDEAKPGQEHEGRRIEVIETPDLHAIRILNWDKYQPERGRGAPLGNKNATKPAVNRQIKPKPQSKKSADPPPEPQEKIPRKIQTIVSDVYQAHFLRESGVKPSWGPPEFALIKRAIGRITDDIPLEEKAQLIADAIDLAWSTDDPFITSARSTFKGIMADGVLSKLIYSIGKERKRNGG